MPPRKIEPLNLAKFNVSLLSDVSNSRMLYYGELTIGKLYYEDVNIFRVGDRVFLVETPYSSKDDKYHIYELTNDTILPVK